MIIKVCGMKYPDNIKELTVLPIDMMGMIFYPKSPRYVSQVTPSDFPLQLQSIKRVGVFVNANKNHILEKINEYKLDIIQLHGNESPGFCEELHETIPIIKAFSIANERDVKQTEAYEDIPGYFLFDTKTPGYGGSGQKFDWSILQSYTGKTPFLLSGGISIEDSAVIKKIGHPQFKGIDLNSRFELEAGRKNINLLKQFIKEIKS